MDCQVSEEALEAYALGMMAESECARLEEHMLICPACQDRLGEIDEYVTVMRRAASDVEAAPAPGWRRLFDWPKPVWAGAVVAGALLVVWIGLARWTSIGPAPQPATILLHATRGSEPLVASVGKGTPLQLVVDLTELPALAAYRAELVDSAGHALWNNTASPREGRLPMVVPGLRSGRYWLRLYTPGGQLLREFGLRVNGTPAAAALPPPSGP